MKGQSKRGRLHMLYAIITLIAALAISQGTASAETTNCTAITTLPYTISAQGIYCLNSDLTTGITTGNAITIATNNVTIDLNGRKLGGLAAGAGTQAKGIYAYQRKNITIRNGSIRGVYGGIHLEDSFPTTISSGHLIEDIRADGNTYMGMWIYGTGNIIRNNQVVNTGGSTASNTAFGIYAVGPGSSIMNNDITNTVENAGSDSYGVLTWACKGCTIENNRISNSALGPGTSYGVNISGTSSNATAINNRISTVDYGIGYYSGTGEYRDNLTGADVTTPYTGGTAVGTNY